MASVDFQSDKSPDRRTLRYALVTLGGCVTIGGAGWLMTPAVPVKPQAPVGPAAIVKTLPLPPIAEAAPVRMPPVEAIAPLPAETAIPAIADAEELLADAGPSITGSPTGAVICDRATEKIRLASQLAQRGAFFASRAGLIDVLEMIAEAKDEKHGAARRTPALAAGLRALDEADDFATGAADADPAARLAVILSSHQTPIAKSPAAKGLLPGQLADLYYRYAQLQLSAAVADEPAGSMALHSLGKLYSQFGRLEPETFPQASRRAFALAQAAVLARPDNYLASHELGVLLAESGHLPEAERVLVAVAAQEPHPTAFRNLARVQRKLGRADYAAANEQHADMLAARTPPNDGNVQWASREQFVAAGDAMGPTQQTPQQGAVQNAVRPGAGMFR